MKNVLNTGAGRGIGFETALAFARLGHAVAAGMRNPGVAPESASIAAREGLDVTLVALGLDEEARYAHAEADFALQVGPK
jgi:NAD(P)-dependent dehydrogenase (short-subunit alcohol dehydrogenase family)